MSLPQMAISMPKKKTSRPEMSWIAAREQWRKRVTIGGRSRDIYGRTQEEVRNKLRDLERQVDAGLVLDDNTTLVALALEWLSVKSKGLRPNGTKMYQGIIDVHIAPFFKLMRVADIKPLHVKKFMTERPQLSNSQQTKLLITLNQIMKTAVENGLIAKNPCDGVKAGGALPKEKVPLTKVQQLMLIESVKGTRAELFVLLCLFAGLRREEALGLIWSNVHIDTDTPYIDVRHTVTFDHSRPVHSEQLKTKSAYRSIPVPTILADALSSALKLSKSIFVVPAVHTGGAMSEQAYERLWEIVRKRAQFPVHAHLLRHTYLTELCASGMDIKKIQYLAGHEDVTMTLKIYTHTTANTPQELSGKIMEIFSILNSDT